MNVLPVGTHFSKYFDVTFANTPELLRQVGQVRFDVYCREFGFLREGDYPDGIERDDYDAYSLHCLVIHKETNTPAGCVRLVKVPQNNLSLLLPLEKFCGSSLNHNTLHPSLFPVPLWVRYPDWRSIGCFADGEVSLHPLLEQVL